MQDQGEKMLKFRLNAMKILSIDSFENITGGINGGCKDVYFVRSVGMNASLAENVVKMDSALSERMNRRAGFYKRIRSLPKLTSPDEAAFYSECYEKWLESGKKSLHTHLASDETAEAILSEAFLRTITLFRSGSSAVSGSIEKNFAVKMMFWLDSLFGSFTVSRSERISFKIAAENIVKRQEYLFFYMLTLIGCDVLLIQSRCDIADAEESLGLSDKFVLGGFGDCRIPAYEPRSSGKNTVDPASVTANVSAQKAEQNAPIRITLPERERRSKTAAEKNLPVKMVVPERERRTARPSVQAVQSENRSMPADSVQRREKTFEELARLASSVVMIAICDRNGNVLGTGSGIMVGRGGYILTNNHVASGGRFYSVRIEDDDKLYDTDEVIKYNPLLDLAVIRIQRRLNPIPVYSGSQKLVRGQKVVAIGSPMGLFNSVSDGIISGFRTIRDVDMIQFTAPTSHGSSGGAVLNMFGEVIGISTAGIDEGQNLNLAMGYECINGFIRGFV